MMRTRTDSHRPAGSGTGLRLRASSGFSLMEVLISLALMSVVTIAIFRAYLTQHESYLQQEDVTEVQQGARASLDEMTRQIRMAGFGLPVGMNALEWSDANPDTIAVRYQMTDCDTWLEDPLGSTDAPIECGSSIGCFNAGEWAFIFEPDSGGGEWFQISSVDTINRIIEHAGFTFEKAYIEDAVVLQMYQVRFFLQQDNDGIWQLMCELPGQAPFIYAERIEDLQFQYRTAGGVLLDEPLLLEDIREVLISVTGVTQTMRGDSLIDIRRTFQSSTSLRNL